MNYHSKIFEAKVAVGEPTDEDLALINRFAKKTLTADQVYVASMCLANTAVDRSFERFPISYLEQFSDTIVGKSLLIGHDHRAAPEGLFFKAGMNFESRESRAEEANSQAGDSEPATRNPEPVSHLEASFYVVNTKQNEHLRAQVDGGVYRYVSIGFQYEDLICDICGDSLFSRECPHVPGREYDGELATATYGGAAEAVEGSIVYLGAQYGAELLKARAERDARRMAIIKDESTEHSAQSTEANPSERKGRAEAACDLRAPSSGLWAQVEKHGDALDKDSPWDWDWTRDANAIIEDLGWEGLKKACAWCDTSEGALPKRKGAYKLPHAKLRGGKLVIYYRGVVAATAALLGARGGVDIPETDRRGVYDHLARHYREFNEEPPPYDRGEPTADMRLATADPSSQLRASGRRQTGDGTLETGAQSTEHGAESREVRVESRGSSIDSPRLDAPGGELPSEDHVPSSKMAELEVSLSVANRLIEEHKEKIAELEPLAEDGKLYRENLLAEIRRLAVAIGQDTQGALAAEALYGADCKTIAAVHEEYQQQFDGKFPPPPHSAPHAPVASKKETDASEYA